MANKTKSPVKLLSFTEYFRDGSHWKYHQIKDPSWTQVEKIVRQMDNFCFPTVQLSCAGNLEDEDAFDIVGGNGRWALFHHMGEWQYDDSKGGNEEVRLWESDQGYICKDRNIIKNIDKVLEIVKIYYDTGSYAKLNNVH